jgi:hypothetical protein
MDQAHAEALLATPTYTRARAAIITAIGAGHRVVLLLSDHAPPAAGLLRAAIRDLAPAGRAVHVVAGPRLAAADLSHADRRVVVAIANLQDRPTEELRILDRALARPAGPQLLLSATPAFRTQTAASGLITLHFAPFVVYLPRLPDADAATYLRALTGRVDGSAVRRLRTASGDPLAIERLARRSRPTMADLASLPTIAALLDRPLAALAASLVLAAACFAITLVPQRTTVRPLFVPTPHTVHLATLPPPPTVSGPFVSDDDSDDQGTSSQSDTGVTVSRVDPDDLLSPRLVAARPGESLAALYRRAYRGLVAPPFVAIQTLNPNPIKPGTVVICPAPAAGWPGPAR